MGITEDYKPWIDKYGLVQPDQGVTSQNGLRFTAEYIVALRRKGKLVLEAETLRTIYERCQKFPGVWSRSPENEGDITSIDDYIGVGLASKLLDADYAKRWLKHGRNHDWIFNNVDGKDKTNQSANMDRFPALITHMQYAAGENPGIWSRLYWIGALIWTAFTEKKSQDPWILSWMMTLVVPRQKYLLENLAKRFFVWRFKKMWFHGVGEVLLVYWKGNSKHPSVKHLWDVWD